MLLSEKKCFICGDEFKGGGPIGAVFRPDGAAHDECLWNTAKHVMEGEMELINDRDE
jgi:hypothetical protein|tara:strand:+ start:239 stop:409 length:171 start_codon:yes stop_codon:yes gene_type:complete